MGEIMGPVPNVCLPSISYEVLRTDLQVLCPWFGKSMYPPRYRTLRNTKQSNQKQDASGDLHVPTASQDQQQRACAAEIGT